MERLLAVAVVVPLLAFSGLMGTAMASYPGGTWEDPHEAGHSQLRNYFCDLERPVALNGQPNDFGAACADWSLVAFSIALAPFFLAAPRVFAQRKRLGQVVAVSGVLCALGGVGIVMVPSYKYGAAVHGVAVLLAAVPGLTAIIATTVGHYGARTSAPAIWKAAVLTLVVTALSVAVFAVQLMRGVETTTGLPVLEKLAVFGSMVWMVLTVRETMRIKRATGVTPS